MNEKALMARVAYISESYLFAETDTKRRSFCYMGIFPSRHHFHDLDKGDWV